MFKSPSFILRCMCVVFAICPVATCSAERRAGESQRFRYVVQYATYLGGKAWDQAREVIPYPDGTVLIGAMSASSNMPTTAGVVQPKYAGDDPSLGHGGVIGGDGYLARLSADGSEILAATYFGGSKQERGVYGMLLDSEGNIVIGSATRSPDMPTTDGAYQPRYGGPDADMYAAKLSPDLKRVLWCTYFGASKNDWPRGGIALDGHDNVIIVGGTNSKDFVTTQNAYQRELKGERDGAIVKLSADGARLIFSTLLGGSGWDGLMGAQVDRAGNVYVAGHTRSSDFPMERAPQSRFSGKFDCFLAKLSDDGSALVYSTYLGGVENEFAEHRPWLGRDGSFLLTGVTGSRGFPTTAGAFQKELTGRTDGFLTRMSPNGRQFAFSTLIGGSGGEFFLMPTPDRDGNMFLVGHTTSEDYPVTSGALQSKYGGGKRQTDGDGALAVFSSDGSRLLYSTYFGGSGDDLIRSVALGPNGGVYLVGSTSSPDFPVTSNAVQRSLGGNADAFVVKLVPAD